MKPYYFFILFFLTLGITKNSFFENNEETLIEKFFFKQEGIVQPIITFQKDNIKNITDNNIIRTVKIENQNNIFNLEQSDKTLQKQLSFPLYEITQKIGALKNIKNENLRQDNFINSICLNPIEASKITVIEIPIVEESTLNTESIENEESVSEIKESTLILPIDDVGLYIIQIEEGTNSSLIGTCQFYLQKAPTNVRQFLADNEVHIYLTDTNLAQRFFPGEFSGVLGTTIYADKAIYIKNEKHAIQRATLHEMGHIIDKLTGWSSSTEEFIRYYNEEKNTFVEVGKEDSHNTTDTIEFFAEIVNQALLYPDTCSTTAPNSYNYVMNILNNL